LTHARDERKDVAVVVEDGSLVGVRVELALDVLEMLRRTKVERADDLGLPPRIVNVRRDFFTEEEEEPGDRGRRLVRPWCGAASSGTAAS
jgi:hypothetical protein